MRIKNIFLALTFVFLCAVSIGAQEWPEVSSVFPFTGPVGTAVTITTSAQIPSGGKVYFDSVSARCGEGNPLSNSENYNDERYVYYCTLPNTLTPGDVLVHAGDGATFGQYSLFAVEAGQIFPEVTSLNLLNGAAGTRVTVQISSYMPSDATIYFDSVPTSCYNWNQAIMGGPYEGTCTVPNGITPGSVSVRVGNGTAFGTGLSFTVEAGQVFPDIFYLSPGSGQKFGAIAVKITSPMPAGSQIYFGSTPASCGRWIALASSQIVATCTIPNIAPGTVTVRAGNGTDFGTGESFTVEPGSAAIVWPDISALSPSTGPAGTVVLINIPIGMPEGGEIYFADTPAVCEGWRAVVGSKHRANCTVPNGLAPGSVSVRAGNGVDFGTGKDFTIEAGQVWPTFTLNTHTGLTGSSVMVIVNSSRAPNARVYFADIAANCSEWTNYDNTKYYAYCTVPAALTAGITNVRLGDGTYFSSPSSFTVQTLPSPTITAIAPATGWDGTPVTITGSNLGDGASVTFNGIAAVCTNNTDTSIICAAPNKGVGGDVGVMLRTSYGPSNSLKFSYDAQYAPSPTARDHSKNVYHGLGSVSVDLSLGAGNGPITGAAITTPCDAAHGTAVLSGTALSFTPADGFEGAAQVKYTLTNHHGNTSAPATVIFNVFAQRPDPTKDAQVRAVVEAQTTAVKRVMQTQMNNFKGRLAQIRGASELRNNYNVSLGIKEAEQPPLYAFNTNAIDEILAQNTQSAPGSISVTDAVKVWLPANEEPANMEYASWLNGYINWGSETSAADIDYTTLGVSGGLDKKLSEKLIAGFGVGYSHDKTDAGQNSDTEADGYNLALYGSYAFTQKVYFEGLLAYSYIDMESNRASATGNAKGKPEANQIFGAVAAGYVYTKDKWYLSPYARMEAGYTRMGSYSESGAGINNLKYGASNIDMFATALGVKSSYTFKQSWGALIPKATLEYLHNFDSKTNVSVGYADIGTMPYKFASSTYSRDNISFGLGVDTVVKEVWNFNLDWRYSKGDNDHNNTFAGQIRYYF